MEHLFDNRMSDALPFSVLFGLRASFLSCVHVRKGLDRTTNPEHFEHRSLDWENVSELFRVTIKAAGWTNIITARPTPAPPRVNELKSAIKDENAKKTKNPTHPDIRVVFKVKF